MKSLKNALVVLSWTLVLCCQASAGTMMTGLASRETPTTAALTLQAALSALQAVTALL